MVLFRTSIICPVFCLMFFLCGCPYGVYESPSCLQLLNTNDSSVRVVVGFVDGREHVFSLCQGQSVGLKKCDSIDWVAIDDHFGVIQKYSKGYIDSAELKNGSKMAIIASRRLEFIGASEMGNRWKMSNKSGCGN